MPLKKEVIGFEMECRRFVVSDIHGNYKALMQVLKMSMFNYNKDELIVVGDVVDGYNGSYEVVEELLKIKKLVFVIGNHEVFFMSHISNGWAEHIWLSQGGKETIASYKSNDYYYGKIPKKHRDFFNNGKYWYEVDNMLFVHGGFNYPEMPWDTSKEVLTWDRDFLSRCRNGLKVKEWAKVFIGHTTTENEGASPIIMDFNPGISAKVIQIDCGAGWHGRLCLYNIDTDEYILSDYVWELNN